MAPVSIQYVLAATAAFPHAQNEGHVPQKQSSVGGTLVLKASARTRSIRSARVKRCSAATREKRCGDADRRRFAAAGTCAVGIALRALSPCNTKSAGVDAGILVAPIAVTPSLVEAVTQRATSALQGAAACLHGCLHGRGRLGLKGESFE